MSYLGLLFLKFPVVLDLLPEPVNMGLQILDLKTNAIFLLLVLLCTYPLVFAFLIRTSSGFSGNVLAKTPLFSLVWGSSCGLIHMAANLQIGFGFGKREPSNSCQCYQLQSLSTGINDFFFVSFHMFGSNNFQPILTRIEVISSPSVHLWVKSGTRIAAERLVSNETEMNSSTCQIIVHTTQLLLTGFLQRNVTPYCVKVPSHPIIDMC